MTRIAIADDHGVLRAGLRALLERRPGFEVVGEAATGQTAVSLAGELTPDVMLLDVNLPDLDGIEVTRRIHAELPDVHVLILTVHEDVELLREAIRAGASGYVVKRAAEVELINAIDAVERGEVYVHSSMTGALLDGFSPTRTGPAHDVERLTPREREVLEHVARGYTSSQIGELLGISVRTVESHRANIMAKLGLRNRAELVQYALDRGLLET